jgi:dTDP-4-dehydrorhamnose 3,5-epimerase
MITVEQLPLQDACVIRLRRLVDNRGWFTETFRESWLEQAGIQTQFFFEFWSFSESQNTVRGMHTQTANQPQAKLVSVLNGSIQDVLIDARQDSPTFGQHCSVTLTRDDAALIYVPRGFYHGFITLEPNTYVGYKLDNYHDGPSECGVMWDDPELNIDWPRADNYVISQRDQSHPSWNDCYKFKENL